MKSLSRIITVLLLFITFCKADFIIDKKVSVDKNLKKKIELFWKAYQEKDAKSMYALEAPYFRVLYNFDLYKAYVNTLNTPKSIYLKEINIEDSIIKGSVVLEFEEKNVTIIDKWIKVDDNFYHKSEVFMLFEE